LLADPRIMLKKLLKNNLFSILIIFSLISCHKSEKINSPVVDLISPVENSMIQIPDTIEIQCNIQSERAIESVSISIVNANYISIFGTNTINAPQTVQEIQSTLILRSLQNLDEAPYYILISVHDGMSKWNSYFPIQLTMKPLYYKGFYLFSQGGINETRIDFYDPQLNDTIFIQSSGNYLDSDISNFFKKTYKITEIPHKLRAYSIDEKQLDWEAGPQFPNPGFTDIQVDEDRIYAGMENGQIVGYSQLSGQQKLITGMLTDSIPQRIIILENWIVSDYLSRLNGNQTLVTFFKETGVIRQKQPIDFQILSFINTVFPDKVMVVGNKNQSGIAALYDARNNYFEDIRVIDEGNITAVCSIDEMQLILSIDNSLYIYNYELDVITALVSLDDSPENLYFEYISNQIIVQFEKEISLYQFPGMEEVASLNFEQTLNALQLYYQND